MIKNRNKGDFVLQLGPSITTIGTKVSLAVGVVESITAPFAGTISGYTASLGVMGTDGTGAPTQDVRVDIKINGTSIFASAANSIVWAHAGQVGTANTPSLPSSNGTLTTNPPSFNKGDDITLEILQILNGTSPTQPKDLCAWLSLSPKVQATKPTFQGSLSENF